MRKVSSLFLIAMIIVSLNSCSPSKKSTVDVIGSWVNKEQIQDKKANSVFIVVLTQNMATRSLMENDLAAAATSNGIKAIRSLSVLTPVTGVPDSVVIAAFGRQVKASG